MSSLRQLVLRNVCARCGAIWYLEVEEGKQPPAPVSLELKLANGEDVQNIHFPVVCPSCTATITNYVNGIAKELKRRPGKRRAKKEEVVTLSDDDLQET